MNPRDVYGLPAWESDFWRDLMEETHVTAPGGWSVPKGEPDMIFEEATGVSRFDNGNVIVGEIVEEGDDVQLLEIGAKP